MHGINFLTLTIRNFMSFGNNITVIPLDRSTSTLIEGVNLDNTSAGITSNGSGKSSILNAFVYAIYDTPISDINKDNMVNNINGKHMEVTLEFTKNNIHYKIKRERKMKAGAAGNNTYFYIDGVDKTKAGKVNEQILEVIGIPYELFIRVVIYSASLVSFLDLKTADQTTFTEELFGVTMLSSKAETLKTYIKSNEQDIQIQKTKIDALEKEHDRHQQQLDNVKKHIGTWEITHTQNIKNAQAALDKSHVDYDNIIHNTSNELQIAIDALNNINTDLDFDALRKDRDTLDQLMVSKTNIDADISNHQKTKVDITKNIKDGEQRAIKINNELVQLAKHQCPYCQQEYNDTTDKINGLESELVEILDNEKKLLNDLSVCNDVLNKLYNQLQNCNRDIEKLKGTPSYKQISDLEQEPERKRQMVDQITQKLNDLKQPNNPYTNLINTHSQKVLEITQEINPYVELYDELLAIELDPIDYTKINELTSEVEHQKFLLKLLTKKDSFIRKAILNKSIPFLNSRLQYYLTSMGLSHKIEFTHELSVNISLVGRSLSFGNLSAGQRARVNIALSLAFRDVLQISHTTINVWMLDEILDVGLDTIGVQSAAKLIKQKAKDEQNSLYVISHRDECYGMFDGMLTVQMIKGFSYIK